MKKVVKTDLKIDNPESGLKLFVRNKCLAGTKRFSADKTILYLHGASQPAEVIFDLPIEGSSWADQLASQGFDVWMMNVRGYGRSEAPQTSAPHFATTEEAINDFDCVLKYIFSERKIDKANIIAWSWGTMISGAYASRNPAAILTLTLLAPPWLSRAISSPEPMDVKKWNYWTADSAFQRLQSGAPPLMGAKILPRATRLLWENALAESQPDLPKTSPQKFRSPTGVLADAVKYWRAGIRFYDPELIQAPTLLCFGEWDRLVAPRNARELYKVLTGAAYKEIHEIKQATHFFQIEECRHELFHIVSEFICSAQDTPHLT